MTTSSRVFPGVYIREIDKSDYIPRLATTILGLVGVADRGPLHEPTLITDENSLINIFGAPPSLSAGKNERQVLTITGSPTGGTFVLAFQGQTTSAVAYNASATTLQSALAALHAIGTGNVAVTGNPGGPWTVEYKNVLGNRNVDPLTLNTNSLTGGSTPTLTVTTLVSGETPPGDYAMHAARLFLQQGRQLYFVRTCQFVTGTGWKAATAKTAAVDTAGAIQWDNGSEAQTVSTGGATSGNFKLVFGAYTTANISYRASAADVQAALEALTSIGSGNVSVSGIVGGPFTVTFKGTLGGINVAPLTAAAGSPDLSGGTGVVITTTIGGDAEHSITFDANSPGDWGNDFQVRFVKIDGVYTDEYQLVHLDGATAGQFKLSFGTVQTADIAVTATAATVQAALEGLTSIGVGNVVVTKVSGNFLVQFTGILGGQFLDKTLTTQGLSYVDGSTPPSGGGGSEAIIEYTRGGVPIPGKTVYRFDVLGPADNSGTLEVKESFSRVMLVNDESVLGEMNAYWLGASIVDGIRNAYSKSAFLTVLKTDFPQTVSDVRNEIATDDDGVDGVVFDLDGGFSALDTAGGTADDYSAAYVGTEVDSTYGPTALQVFTNPMSIDVNMLALPGVTSAAALNGLVSICENRQDCMCILDTPRGLNFSDAIDWHNKAGQWVTEGFKPNSSYAALYWPWMTTFDPYNRETVTLPPSCFVPANYALNDFLTAPWFAPAGMTRGRVQPALALESPTPSPGALESLYSGGNCINPIVDLRGQSITIMGQRTTQRRPTALDRINVRRGLTYLEKAIASSIRVIVFDPNDEQTRAEFLNLVNPVAKMMKNSRGLYDYQIICDDTTNPPDVIDRNELHGVILLKPTKAAEILTIDFALFSTGAEFSIPAESRT